MPTSLLTAQSLGAGLDTSKNKAWERALLLKLLMIERLSPDEVQLSARSVALIVEPHTIEFVFVQAHLRLHAWSEEESIRAAGY